MLLTSSAAILNPILGLTLNTPQENLEQTTVSVRLAEQEGAHSSGIGPAE